MFDYFNFLAYLAKDCLMVFMRRRLLGRNDDTSRRVAHTRAVLLFDPNVMSKLQAQSDILELGCELRDALQDATSVCPIWVFTNALREEREAREVSLERGGELMLLQIPLTLCFTHVI